MASVFYIALPGFILVAWVLLIAFSYNKDGKSLMAPICVLIVGISLPIFLYGLFKIRWNNFRFKTKSLVFIVIALGFFTLYQAIVVFGYSYDKKFFPYSAFFLNFNVIFLISLLYLSSFDKKSEMSSLLERAFPKLG